MTHSVPTQRSSNMGRIAKVVVETGDDDDQAIARIGGLADQPGVVCCLAALDMANDHTLALPRSVLAGIAHPVEYAIGHLVHGDDDIARHALRPEDRKSTRLNSSH